ncbi:uncharacterized protein LOC125845715 [Solanum stenotomum]|uniref:uncharacterized protein LOC125845715 n=1 Tax=Solanum stenotomum TaxID=172797 RepID=UPI0020D13468|nr:uncharacterized protein LOC125845715 [Solanum stenotomum]
MSDELPNTLPPMREVDHKTELEVGTKPPTHAPYRMAPPKLEELRKQLKKLLESGHIRPSKTPYGVSVLFQKNKDGSLRLCIDYRALNKSQKKITPKQTRWKNFPEFDYVLEYKLGRGNVVADTLSGKVELAVITTAHCDIQDAIKDGMQHDLKSMKLMELAAQGKTRRFWVKDGFLLTSERRVYVPNFGSIKWRIIKKSHDTPWTGHSGQRRIRALIEAI